VLWRCGLRRAKALALRPQDLGLDGGTVTVRRGKGGARRVVGIDAGTRTLPGEWLRCARDSYTSTSGLRYDSPHARYEYDLTISKSCVSSSQRQQVSFNLRDGATHSLVLSAPK
jgi:integrase